MEKRGTPAEARVRLGNCALIPGPVGVYQDDGTPTPPLCRDPRRNPPLRPGGRTAQSESATAQPPGATARRRTAGKAVSSHEASGTAHRSRPDVRAGGASHPRAGSPRVQSRVADDAGTGRSTDSWRGGPGRCADLRRDPARVRDQVSEGPYRAAQSRIDGSDAGD